MIPGVMQSCTDHDSYWVSNTYQCEYISV
jgi:hypothetical protein